MKLKDLYLLNENLQQADKVYFKTGLLSNKVREIIINKITNGDGLTKIICDIYYAKLQADLKMGDWVVHSIDNANSYKEKEIYTTENDWSDINRWKETKTLYEQLKSYNKNVFPISDYNLNDKKSIYSFIGGLKQRQLILDMFDKLPSIAKRNMKSDIRQIRDWKSLNKYRDRLEYFMSYFSMLSNRNDEVKQNVLRKMFKSNTNLEELLDFVEDKENLIGGADLTKDEIEKIIEEHYLEVVYSKGNYLIIEVTDVEAIKDLGCNSLWCFTYGRDGSSNWTDWNNYSTNSIIYLFIDFSLLSDDREFMRVLISPLDFFPKDPDDTEINNDKMYYMDNQEVYNPLGVVDEYMGLDKGRKLLNFDMDIQKKPKVKFKDPNQLKLNLENKMKLKEIYNEILDEDYPSSFNMEEFKSLNSFNKRIKYCESNLKRISSGSSRIVYSIDNEKVLKLAKNSKGLAQNEIEIGYSQYNDLKDVVAKTFDYENNNLWVEMELARKVKVSDFKRITGFDFKTYVIAITNYGNKVNQQKNKMSYPELDSQITEAMWEDEFVYDIFSFIGNFDLPVGDLTRLNSYGIVKRDYGDAIVIIDYGLTHDVYTSYYS